MHDHDLLILTGQIKSKDKTKAYFCHKCRSHATHVLRNNKWVCCSCNPLELPDSELMGFTIGEAINLRKS